MYLTSPLLALGCVVVSVAAHAEARGAVANHNPNPIGQSRNETATAVVELRSTTPTAIPDTAGIKLDRLAPDLGYECTSDDPYEPLYGTALRCRDHNVAQGPTRFDFPRNPLSIPIVATQNQQVVRWRELGMVEVQYGKHTCRFRSADLPMVRIVCAK